MKLYYLPGTGSFVAHVALHWANIPHEATAMAREALKGDDYLKINPLGAVPALVDGDNTVTQLVGILSYLDAKYPKAELLGPRDDAIQRGKVYQWLGFLNADVHKVFGPLFNPPAFAREDEQILANLQGVARGKLTSYLELAEQHLGTQDYLTQQVTMVDVYLYAILRWSRMLGVEQASTPNLSAFYTRVGEHPAVRKTLELEGLEA